MAFVAPVPVSFPRLVTSAWCWSKEKCKQVVPTRHVNFNGKRDEEEEGTGGTAAAVVGRAVAVVAEEEVVVAAVGAAGLATGVVGSIRSNRSKGPAQLGNS